MAYNRKDNFFDFKATDLKNFQKFRKIIISFSEYYRLTKHNLMEIDKFYGFTERKSSHLIIEKGNKALSLVTTKSQISNWLILHNIRIQHLK